MTWKRLGNTSVDNTPYPIPVSVPDLLTHIFARLLQELAATTAVVFCRSLPRFTLWTGVSPP